MKQGALIRFFKERWPFVAGLCLFFISLVLLFMFSFIKDPALKGEDLLLLPMGDDLVEAKACFPELQPVHVPPYALLEEAGRRPLRLLNFVAAPIREKYPDLKWYPEREVVAGFAINRDKTSLNLQSYADLLRLDPKRVTLSILRLEPDRGLNYGALIRGLSGDFANKEPALKFLRSFAAQDTFTEVNPEDATVLLAMSDAVEALNRQGGNFEFIVPKEGGILFEKGVLSPHACQIATEFIAFQGPRDHLLSAEDLDREAYLSATERVSRDFRKHVTLTRRFSSKDHRGHVMYALIFLLVIMLWTLRMVSQIYDRHMIAAFLWTIFFLVLWTLVRMLKYSTSNEELRFFLRWLYYVLQLAIPLCMLWVSLMLENKAQKPPRLWYGLLSLNLFLMLLAITNSFHRQILDYTLVEGRFTGLAQYRWGFYLIWITVFMESLLAVLILFFKNRQSPKSWAQIPPLLITVAMLVYGLGYMEEIPFLRESDYTLTMGFFLVLFLDALFRGGLLPVHRGYQKLFKKSTLNMQITDEKGQQILAAGHTPPLEPHVWENLEAIQFQPLYRTTEDLVRCLPIAGGYFIWEDDLSTLAAQERKIRERGEELRIANALLKAQKEVREELASLSLRNEILSRMEGEIQEKQEQLKERIQKLETEEDQELAVQKIAILLCYLKRRCNFFFDQEELVTVAAEELVVYLEELVELSARAGVEVVFLSTARGELSAQKAALCYDVFYAFLQAAGRRTPPVRFLAQMIEGPGLKLLFPFAVEEEQLLGARVLASLHAQGGRLLSREIDELISYELSFEESFHA